MKGKNQKNQAQITAKHGTGQGKMKQNQGKVHKGNHQSMKPTKVNKIPQQTPVSRSNQSRPASSSSATSSSTPQLSALQQKFMDKLGGARFRTINEELYTTSGSSAFQAFSQDPSKFHIYHSGYRIQAQSWPCNPLDYVIQWIQKHHSNAVIADMGCGEARLAATLSNQTVHSFDLVAANDQVTACDIAAVPLPDNSVDVVVFCLSLMGTNLNDFLKEAFRILKINGLVKIVEVRSRFEDGKGIKKFLQYLKTTHAFQLIQTQDEELDTQLLDNKMFFSVECRKIAPRGIFTHNFSLKPCVYKKR